MLHYESRSVFERGGGDGGNTSKEGGDKVFNASKSGDTKEEEEGKGKGKGKGKELKKDDDTCG